MANIKNEFSLSPAARLDFGFLWSDWLDEGEYITDSTWTVKPTDLTLTDKQILGSITSVFVSGGTANKVYYLTNTITTDASPSKRDSRTIVLSCKNR